MLVKNINLASGLKDLFLQPKLQGKSLELSKQNIHLEQKHGVSFIILRKAGRELSTTSNFEGEKHLLAGTHVFKNF